jgi:hypothetical protein
MLPKRCRNNNNQHPKRTTGEISLSLLSGLLVFLLVSLSRRSLIVPFNSLFVGTKRMRRVLACCQSQQRCSCVGPRPARGRSPSVGRQHVLQDRRKVSSILASSTLCVFVCLEPTNECIVFYSRWLLVCSPRRTNNRGKICKARIRERRRRRRRRATPIGTTLVVPFFFSPTTTPNTPRPVEEREREAPHGGGDARGHFFFFFLDPQQRRRQAVGGVSLSSSSRSRSENILWNEGSKQPTEERFLAVCRSVANGCGGRERLGAPIISVVVAVVASNMYIREKCVFVCVCVCVVSHSLFLIFVFCCWKS